MDMENHLCVTTRLVYFGGRGKRDGPKELFATTVILSGVEGSRGSYL
jgi:hypothetical protein